MCGMRQTIEVSSQYLEGLELYIMAVERGVGDRLACVFGMEDRRIRVFSLSSGHSLGSISACIGRHHIKGRYDFSIHISKGCRRVQVCQCLI